jgi:hypothetical protein
MTDQIKPSLMERVRAALIDNPASTTQELARACGMTVNQTAKRVAELVATGKAVTAGKRDCHITGHRMNYWRAVR